MTQELFPVDPYCSDFNAQVVHLGDNYVVLDQTYFFPRSADQSSDRGQIDTFPVCTVIRANRQIRHVVHETTRSALAVGDIVACQVEWERRYRTMRLHTAQHLMQLALHATHDVGLQVGGAVSHERATIAFLPHEGAGPVEIEAVQLWVDTIIGEALVTMHEADHSLDRRRYWHIDGLATLPCDGTHVRSTAEVGAVSVELFRQRSDIIELHAELTAN